MNDGELTAYVNFCRTKVISTKVGPMHAMWDVIFDAVAHLRGKQTICSREDCEDALFEYVHGEVLKPYKEEIAHLRRQVKPIS